jgi:hypothetical protein
VTMTPETFHDLLEDAVSQQPPSPSGRELTEGRRLLRRRRLVSAAGVAATVAVLAGGTAFVLQLDPGPQTLQGTEQVDPSSSPNEALLESCREGNQDDRATDLIFGSGLPRIASVVRTAHQAILAVESAGGRYWAECFVHFDAGEFRSGMTVYDGSQRSRFPGYASGAGCANAAAVDGTCPDWSVWLVDRLPEQVAAVRFHLGDGTRETRPTQDGYVVLNILHRLPSDGGFDADGLLAGFDPILGVTYLDDAGNALAAERWDGSGVGPDHERVEGLPPLATYPSLRGNPLE